MKKQILILLLLPNLVFAWNWIDLWQTKDQQGIALLNKNQPALAAKLFKNKDWKNAALYKSGQYEKAYQQFKNKLTSDAQYNAGNAAAFSGHYQEALAAYDKAIELNPKNKDAFINREIIKKLMQQQNKNDCACNKKNNKSKNENSKQQSSQNEKQKNLEDKQQPSDQAQNKQTSQDKMNQQDKQADMSSKQSAQNQKNAKSSETKQNKTNKSATDSQQIIQSKDGNKNPATMQWQAQDQQKKVLDSLDDDPRGLLERKFLRDYMRRHSDGSVNN